MNIRSWSGTARKNSCSAFSSSDWRGRSALRKPPFNSISFGYASRMESSIECLRSANRRLQFHDRDETGALMQTSLREISRDTNRAGQQTFVNRCGINTPDRGQKHNLFRVGAGLFAWSEMIPAVSRQIIVAFQSEPALRPGSRSL